MHDLNIAIYPHVKFHKNLPNTFCIITESSFGGLTEGKPIAHPPPSPPSEPIEDYNWKQIDRSTVEHDKNAYIRGLLLKQQNSFYSILIRSDLWNWNLKWIYHPTKQLRSLWWLPALIVEEHTRCPSEPYFSTWVEPSTFHKLSGKLHHMSDLFFNNLFNTNLSACTRIMSENSCRLTKAFRTAMLKSDLQYHKVFVTGSIYTSRLFNEKVCNNFFDDIIYYKIFIFIYSKKNSFMS